MGEKVGLVMGSVHEVIEAFRQVPSSSEQGTKFE